MLQDRQIDRMVLKVARLEQIYSDFLVKKTIKPKVTVEKNGKVSEIKKGQRWGEEFKCATFRFVCDGLDENEKYYVYAESGAPEHLVLVNGKKVGMLDYITDAYEAIRSIFTLPQRPTAFFTSRHTGLPFHSAQ